MRGLGLEARAATAAALFLAAAAAAQEKTAGAALQGFEPTGKYALEIDGVGEPEAAIYLSPGAGSVLLLTAPGLSRPLLVRPRAKRVDSVPAAGLIARGDGAVDLATDATIEPAGSFTVDGTSLHLSVGEQRLRLTEKPPLLGLHDASKLAAEKPGYAFHARRYLPTRSTLQALREVGDPFRVRVYFGSWCPRCSRLVPKLLRLCTELSASGMGCEFFAIPRHEEDAPESFWREAQRHEIFRDEVGTVPVAVVYRGGEAIGRIEGSAWGNPEGTLLKIVSGD